MNLQLLMRIGAGHFGEVWLARDAALDRDVAVKFIDAARLGRPAREVFAEAQALHSAQHTNVVDVYFADEIQGRPAIVMEYLPRGSVEAAFRSAPVPVREALEIAAQACRALTHAHGQGLLHRDVKPANLLLAADGTVKLSDFGLACSVADIGAGPLIGYRQHLPPESIEVGYASSAAGDIYAVGVTLYRLLNGDQVLTDSVPHGATLEELVRRGRYPRRDRWLTHIPKSVRRIVRKAMNVDPGRRPLTAEDLRHRIEHTYPLVSFGPAGQPSDLAWVGWSTDGRDRWEIEVRRRPRAQDFQVEVRRSRDERSPRRSGVDSFRTKDRTEAVKHSERLMNRLATDGK